MVLLQGKKLYFSKGPERAQHFLEGGGVQMLVSIQTHITCDFPGGIRTPYPPPPLSLDPHLRLPFGGHVVGIT